MTQQTHPDGTQHGGDEHREPQWYHGPASRDQAGAPGTDPGRESAFGLGDTSRDTSRDTAAHQPRHQR